ncbi:MAG: CHAT domain-containing protein, partial [Planctomycetota bacterium]|nr:CHAT domain-containing protein [Planctomycetota bacterium]
DALAISKAVTALANIRVDLMDHEGVLALVDEAIAVEPRLASRRSHEELIQAKGSTTELYHIGFFSAAASLDMTRAWNLLERGRGRTLLDQLTNRDEIRTRKIPQALRDAEIEARAAERSTRARVHAARRSRSRARIRKAKAAYEAAIAHTATVVADIQRAQRRTGALLHPRPADLATVRRGLDARTAILSLSVMPLRGSIAVLTTTKQVRVVSVWTDAEQQTGVRAFTEAADDETMFERMAETVAELQARLELPEGIERLLVSPDGALAYVPWSLVFPKHEVTIIPSATIWQLLEESAAERGEGVFALGNPEYGAAASRRRGAAASRAGSHWARLVPLPATGVEARAVGSVVLLGEQATEAGVRARLAESKRWRSIHFACHGLIDAAHPLLSCLAVTAAAPDDGFLTAAEVFTLDARADLVVLSACETGRGDAWYGEGVVGLTQAFLFAGAPRVLCSLWKVDDEATR